MNKLIKTSLLLISITFSFGQDLDYNNKAEAIKICTAIQGSNFSSVSNADNALDKILAVIGASKRFVLQECSNINNAVALTYSGVRYIMYDPKFMSSLSNSNQWANMFILAHEIGHHINGHTVDVLAQNNQNKPSLATKRQQEEESDEFAGFVLGRLGASLSQASLTINSLANNSDDSYSTHPSKSKRLAAVKKGWTESGGYVDTSELNIAKGKTIDSKYSNSRYANVEYRVLTRYYSDGVYEGYVSMVDDKPFGYGKIYGTNGDVYEGEMAGGKRNGYGVEKFIMGQVKEGFWVNNVFSGKGILTNNETKYIGNFGNGMLQGQGIMYGSTGNIYEGYFVDFNFEGKGKYTWAEGAVYEGDFINNKKTGKGKLIQKNGGIYEGDFIDDFSTGKGKYTYANGDIYEGDFVHSEFTGKGKQTYASGDIYEGDWLNSKMTGKGKYIWAVTNGGGYYEGYYIDGFMTGNGKYTYANGDIYEGDWLNDKMTGKGIKTYVDGRIEKGNWKDGVLIK